MYLVYIYTWYLYSYTNVTKVINLLVLYTYKIKFKRMFFQFHFSTSTLESYLFLFFLKFFPSKKLQYHLFGTTPGQHFSHGDESLLVVMIQSAANSIHFFRRPLLKKCQQMLLQIYLIQRIFQHV